MKKRIFAVFLACSMVLGVFSGCGETETTESQESGTLSTGETVSTQGEEKESVVIAMGPTSEPEAVDSIHAHCHQYGFDHWIRPGHSVLCQ